MLNCEELIQDPAFRSFADCKDSQSFNPINCGGCGIYALAVARYLTTRQFDNLQLVACCRYDDIETQENINNNNHIIDHIPSHVVVKLGPYCFDASGVVDFLTFTVLMYEDRKECFIIDYNEQLFLKAINQTDKWNRSFKRSMWIPKIEKNFNISLNDVRIDDNQKKKSLFW